MVGVGSSRGRAGVYLRFCDWYGHRRGVLGPPRSGPGRGLRGLRPRKLQHFNYFQ